MILSAA